MWQLWTLTAWNSLCPSITSSSLLPSRDDGRGAGLAAARPDPAQKGAVARRGAPCGRREEPPDVGHPPGSEAEEGERNQTLVL